MAELAQFTIERIGPEVEIRLRVIPDTVEDEDLEHSGTGISFSRRDAIHFGLKIIRAALGGT